MLDLDGKIMQFILKDCREKGYTHEVDDDYYEEFFKLSGHQIRVMTRAILSSKSADLRKMLSSPSKEPLDTVALFFELIFRGIMIFSEKDGSLCFIAPIGPPPTEEMEHRFIDKILDSKFQIERVYHLLLEEKASG